jgi:hypothetical protein
MADSNEVLKRIRKKFKVPAYNGVKIQTANGEIGIIKGAEGGSLKVYFQGKKDPVNCDPDKVAYLGFELKK